MLFTASRPGLRLGSDWTRGNDTSLGSLNILPLTLLKPAAGSPVHPENFLERIHAIMQARGRLSDDLTLSHELTLHASLAVTEL